MTGKRHLRITVDGNAYDVHVEVIEESTNGNHERIRNGRGGEGGAAAEHRPPRSPVFSKTPKQSLEDGVIAAPMAGVVIEILVTVGDTIELDQPVMRTEAMKMLAYINATMAGTVKEILVADGETVTEGQPVLRLE
jgi:biotin carboxyl carrier protein